MAQYGIFQYGTQQYGLGNPPAVTGDPVVFHQFNLDSIVSVVGTPVPRASFNQFDEFGLLLDLPRLKEEKNWAYKRRLLDVFVNRANSAYRGLVNGITRELGLSLFQPILINPKTNADGTFVAPDPYIRFDGVYLYLYSDYANNVLDYQIDRYEPGGNYEHITRLVDFVNTSLYFEASIEPDIDEYTRSMTILNQSNRNLVEEAVTASTKFSLNNPKVVENSIVFSDTLAFSREVSDVSVIERRGDYFINYPKGFIESYSVPALSSTVRYQHSTFPFKPYASPIILHDINNDNFKVKMFEQVLQDDGTYEHGMPTEIGVDVVNSLLEVYPLYWGI